MEKKLLPRRALRLWQLRAAAATFLAGILIAVLLSDFVFWYWLAMGLAGAGFLFFFCVYYPFKRIKFSYFLYCEQLVVDCGVFYSRRRVIPLGNVQYLTILRTPDMLPFGLASVIVHSVGSSLYLPCLLKEEAEQLQQLCARQQNCD